VGVHIDDTSLERALDSKYDAVVFPAARSGVNWEMFKKKSIENGDHINSAKNHRLTYKDGSSIEVYSLDTWAYDNKHNPSHLRAIRSGKRKSHKGIVKVETFDTLLNT